MMLVLTLGSRWLPTNVAWWLYEATGYFAYATFIISFGMLLLALCSALFKKLRFGYWNVLWLGAAANFLAAALTYIILVWRFD